jgi:hypothetical protein
VKKVVMVDAFHDFEKPVQWLINLKKYIKAGASIAIVDMDPSKFPPDRPYTHAWAREKIVAYAAEAGYVLVKATNDYRMHQVLVFRLAPVEVHLQSGENREFVT